MKKIMFAVITSLVASSVWAGADGISISSGSKIGADAIISGATNGGVASASQASFATGVQFGNTNIGNGTASLHSYTNGADSSYKDPKNFTESNGNTDLTANVTDGIVATTASGGTADAGSTGTAYSSKDSVADFGTIHTYNDKGKAIELSGVGASVSGESTADVSLSANDTLTAIDNLNPEVTNYIDNYNYDYGYHQHDHYHYNDNDDE